MPDVVTIPLTGSGDATAQVDTRLRGTAHQQVVVLGDATTTGIASPSSAEPSTNAIGLPVRQINRTHTSGPPATNDVGEVVRQVGFNFASADPSSFGVGQLVRQVPSEVHLGQAGGHTTTVMASLNRPTSTPAYTAGDVVTSTTATGPPLTFTGCARVANLGGDILGATLIDHANMDATRGQFELFLWETTVNIPRDNASFAPTTAELAKFVGSIPFTQYSVGKPSTGVSGNLFYPARIEPIAFDTTGSANLYGTLVVRNGYPSVAGERIDVKLVIRQD